VVALSLRQRSDPVGKRKSLPEVRKVIFLVEMMLIDAAPMIPQLFP
jgi:hypothetical protein